MYTDSHCHLSDPSLLPRLPEIRQAMQAALVDRALCICTTLEEFDAVHALALQYSNFWATVGVHPDNDGPAVQEPTLPDLISRAQNPRVVAIGETGLDYYRLAGRTVAEMQWQRDRFSVHIQAARHTGLPLVVHTRSASSDTLAILQSEGLAPADGLGVATGVFNCFTESQEVARAALDMGFYISFSGILTFKNAADLREVAGFVPLDRLLIETDSPYLAPMPYRGKTNDPSLVPLVALQVAKIKNLTVEAIAGATTDNFNRLFTKVAL